MPIESVETKNLEEFDKLINDIETKKLNEGCKVFATQTSHHILNDKEILHIGTVFFTKPSNPKKESDSKTVKYRIEKG